jgi:plasmid maintenance system antidote protein VapI
MALRLSKLSADTPEFCLSAQRAVDLWNAERENKQENEKITPLKNLFFKFTIYILALSNKLVIIILY